MTPFVGVNSCTDLSLLSMRWNSAKCFADYLDLNAQELCMGKNVLELGAGAGLPSLVTALNGARKVTEIKKF